MPYDRMCWWAIFALAAAVPHAALRAADQPADDLVPMIITLVGDKDKEMRAVGFQQMRDSAKGAAATERFAALLPKVSTEIQVELLSALADRGDKTARAAVLEMLKSPDASVKMAAIQALGPLGQATDVPLLVKSAANTSQTVKSAAISSLVRLSGSPVNLAIVAELKRAAPAVRADLISVLARRRALDCIPSLLAAASETDADAGTRSSALAALGELAQPQHIPDMLTAVLKAPAGPDREAAEKAVMLVCNRIKDGDRRADSLLAAFGKRSETQQIVLLTTLGRVGGPAVLKVVEAAMADANPHRRDAGIKALCLWPDASVAPQLLELATKAASAGHRSLALRALIRVAPLPDKRPDAERLALLRKTMSMVSKDDQRNLILRRARAIRSVETLRFVAPYMDQPAYAQEACATVVELAHHRKLREPNKAEFDKALDTVIRTSKDAGVVDRAKRYQKGQT